jgi:hypothetical protein
VTSGCTKKPTPTGNDGPASTNKVMASAKPRVAGGCAAPFAGGPTALPLVIPGMPADIVAGDVDQDGYLDLVIATGNDLSPGQLRVLFGPFDGGVPEASWAYDAGGYYRRLAVGDVDGDGDLDIAVALVSAAPPPSRFRHFDDYPCDGGSPWDSAAGPTALDASLVATSDGGSVAVFRSTGTNSRDLGSGPVQTFGYTPTVSDDSLIAGSVDFGDFNGDGHLDLAVGGGSEGIAYTVPVQVLQNDGHGTLRAPSADAGWRSGTALFGYSVRFLDWNGDGVADLLVTDTQGTRWGHLFFGKVSGSSALLDSNPSVFSFGQLQCADTIASDALGQDGGGTSVAIAVNASQRAYVQWPGASAVVQTSGGSQVPIVASPFTTGVRLSDLNADGKLDLVLATLSFVNNGGQCGQDPLEAGTLYCADDVLGANTLQPIASPSAFYAEGVAAGDLHEATQRARFVSPACTDAGARLVIPIPDPRFAGVAEGGVMAVSPDAGSRQLTSNEYATGPNDRLVYLTKGLSCGSSVEITYLYSPVADLAACTTNPSCTNTTISILFNNIVSSQNHLKE